MVLSFGSIYGPKVVIIVGGVGVGVKEAGTREGGMHERVDRWVVRRAFIAEVRGASLPKLRKLGG